jgi:hypothetical protein
MKSARAFLLIALAACVWLAGCSVDNSGKKPPYDFPKDPHTSLTVAPQEGDTVNHFFSVRWAGNSSVGEIVAFRLSIDNQLVTVTTQTDTALAFEAPLSYIAFHHTLTLAAVDNDGNVDPQPATRSFYVTNVAPHSAFDAANSIPNGATVGQGFRVTIAATDANPSYLFYTISLDDTNHWLPWSTQDAYVFSPPSLIAEDTAFFAKVNGVPNAGLTAGTTHTVYGRTKDAGEALSNIAVLTFSVADTFRPTMDVAKSGTYAGNSLYPDGSAYYVGTSGTETKVSFSASAAAYYGEILSYRWQIGSNGWTAWSSTPEATVTDLTAGTYMFQLMARDVAGRETNVDTFYVRLVNQSLSRSLLIVDETADQNGRPGAPNDGQVDSFYTAVLSGVAGQFNEILQLDYARHQINNESYVSPYDLASAGLVLWHADDRTDINLSSNSTLTGPYRNLTLLRDYLGKGGRLILSGYDVMAGFTDADSVSFSGTQFAYTRLRIIKAWRTPLDSYVVQGITGAGDVPGIGTIPTCNIDSAKTLQSASRRGRLQTCWGFQPRGECVPLGYLMTSNPDDPATGKVTAYVYDLSFRVAVFGVPLYYCRNDQVTELMNALVPHMIIGLQ